MKRTARMRPAFCAGPAGVRLRGFRYGWATLALAGLLAGQPGRAEVSWDGGVTAVYQYADDARADAELTVSADLFATIARRRGEWLIYLEGSTTPDAGGVSAFYPTANADAGSVLNRDGDGGVQISEFNYTFRYAGGRSLTVGLIDPSAWLDRSRITNDENTHFLNGSFVNNATIDFPDYTLGGVLRNPQSGARPEMTLLVASSSGIADLPDRSYQDLLDLTADERGAFLGVGAGWRRESRVMRLGAWLRSDDHPVPAEDGRTESNYGAYAVVGWQRDANAVNVRAGFANRDVSVATRFVAVAYQHNFPWALVGAGIARTDMTDQFREAALTDVHHAELFVRFPFRGDRGHITPSVQYAENPGFTSAGSVDSSSAMILGVRLHVSF